MTQSRPGIPLHAAAWPDLFDSLQTAYAELNETQFELEHRIAEVEEARELFERVVDSMSEALLLTDRAGRLLRLNRAAGALLGVRPEDVVGRPLAEVWAAARIPTTPWQLLERAPTGTVSGLDVDFPGDDGTVRNASVSCGLLRDKFGAISGLLLVAADVTMRTRRARSQQFLAEASAALGRSLDSRTMLRDLARVCVAHLADWCVVVVDDRSEGRRVAVAHVDEDAARRLGLLAQGPLRDVRWSPALAAALESGRTEVRHGRPFAPGSHAGTAGARLAGDSTAAVPLVARGRVLGAFALVWCERPSAERAHALELAEELAQRAALSIDNARLHEAERRSRRTAETVAERLRRVQEVTDAALAHLDLDGLLESLLERIVAGLHSDVASVLLFDDERGTLVPRAVHGMPDDDHHEIPLGRGYVGRIAARRQPEAVAVVDPAELAMPSLERCGISSLAGVPLLLEGRVTGVLVVGSRTRRSFAAPDMTLLRLVADRAALAIGNARLYERERTIAETLQRSLLPRTITRIPGLEVGARYLPGGAGVDVGGDWYDVIALPGGRAGVVVGDVGGRGLRAAATMGQLRTALRTYASEGFTPARALERLNLLSTDTDDLFATAVYLIVDPATGALTYASAGHLPPLVLHPDGRVSRLEEGRWLPLGVRPPVGAPRDAGVALEPGTTVLLYTDGLVERRSAPIDVGLERLERALREGPAPLDALLDHVLERLLADEQAGADDVAVLAFRLGPRHVEDLHVAFLPRADEVARVRHALDDWLATVGLPAPARTGLVLAANEVCANSIEHPRGCTAPDVHLHARVADGLLTIAIKDSGSWRPPTPQPTRGFGLRIARELADEVLLEPGESGTTVVLRHRLPPDGTAHAAGRDARPGGAR